MSKKLIIAVDGPAGSGKSTTFRQVARALNYQFVDTGLMYRAFTHLAVQQGVDFADPRALIALIPQFDYGVRGNQVYLNNENITSKLTAREVVENINKVTVIPEIRAHLVIHQQKLAQESHRHGLIMVGRDITSVVLPNADLKIYLDSSLENRVNRRLAQEKHGVQNRQALITSIAQRDYKDKHREDGPLVRTKDSWYINNSHLSLEETVKMVVAKVRQLEQ